MPPEDHAIPSERGNTQEAGWFLSRSNRARCMFSRHGPRWDRKADFKDITVPTLVIGATHDTMGPEHMHWVSAQVRNGSCLLCPEGSDLCMWDDQQYHTNGVIRFLEAVDGGKSPISFQMGIAPSSRSDDPAPGSASCRGRSEHQPTVRPDIRPLHGSLTAERDQRIYTGCLARRYPAGEQRGDRKKA